MRTYLPFHFVGNLCHILLWFVKVRLLVHVDPDNEIMYGQLQPRTLYHGCYVSKIIFVIVIWLDPRISYSYSGCLLSRMCADNISAFNNNSLCTTWNNTTQFGNTGICFSGNYPSPQFTTTKVMLQWLGAEGSSLPVCASLARHFLSIKASEDWIVYVYIDTLFSWIDTPRW